MEHDSQPEAYYVHVWIRGIHPMLWRRFLLLRSCTIGTIWFHSCALAGGQVGKRFCPQLALNAQCRVVAPEEIQTEWFAFLNVLFMPKGCIDDYEGKVYLASKRGAARFQPE